MEKIEVFKLKILVDENGIIDTREKSAFDIDEEIIYLTDTFIKKIAKQIKEELEQIN